MSAVLDMERYVVAERALDRHLAACADCPAGRLCTDGFALVAAESQGWTAFQLADPRAAAGYDQARNRAAGVAARPAVA